MKKMRQKAHRDGTNVNIASEKTKSPFGVRGVGRSNSRRKPFEAKLFFRGRTVYREMFATLEEAIAARKEAEEKYYKPLIEKWEREDEANSPKTRRSSQNTNR